MIRPIDKPTNMLKVGFDDQKEQNRTFFKSLKQGLPSFSATDKHEVAQINGDLCIWCLPYPSCVNAASEYRSLLIVAYASVGPFH